MDGQALHELDRVALETLAGLYARTLRTIQARIAEIDAREKIESQAEKRINALAAIPAMIRQQIDQGRDLNFAISHVTRLASCPPETVTGYWKQWLRAQDQKTLQERTIMVMRLAQKGLHNREISHRTGLSESTVSRTISRALNRHK